MSTERPTVTVRSMATLLHWPVERKVRELRRQKYPKEGSPAFRIPYYSCARTGIRRYYRNGNALSALAEARSKTESLSPESKRDNNKRVLDSFQKNGALLARVFQLQRDTTYVGRIPHVELRVSPDMRALEDGMLRYIFYHWKSAALTGQLAEDTLQLACLALEQNGLEVPLDSLEYVDLFTTRVYKIRARSADTEKLLRANARVIAEIWPTL